MKNLNFNKQKKLCKNNHIINEKYNRNEIFVYTSYLLLNFKNKIKIDYIQDRIDLYN